MKIEDTVFKSISQKLFDEHNNIVGNQLPFDFNDAFTDEQEKWTDTVKKILNEIGVEIKYKNDED